MFGVYEICCTFAFANEKQRHSQAKHGAIAQMVRAHDS